MYDSSWLVTPTQALCVEVFISGTTSSASLENVWHWCNMSFSLPHSDCVKPLPSMQSSNNSGLEGPQERPSQLPGCQKPPWMDTAWNPWAAWSTTQLSSWEEVFPHIQWETLLFHILSVLSCPPAMCRWLCLLNNLLRVRDNLIFILSGFF